MLDACSHFSLSIGEYSKNVIFSVQLGHVDNKKYTVLRMSIICL